ncbi:hypothetical protein C7S13_5658 [Burkholderia cepacia]|nr:hypothetical protein [Burkholderia cepacia]
MHAILTDRHAHASSRAVSVSPVYDMGASAATLSRRRYKKHRNVDCLGLRNI